MKGEEGDCSELTGEQANGVSVLRSSTSHSPDRIIITCAVAGFQGQLGAWLVKSTPTGVSAHWEKAGVRARVSNSSRLMLNSFNPNPAQA